MLGARFSPSRTGGSSAVHGERLGAGGVFLAGAVEVLDRRAAVAAVDPVVAGAELEPRQRGVGGDGVDRPGQAVEVDAVDDGGDVHGELLALKWVTGRPGSGPAELARSFVLIWTVRPIVLSCQHDNRHDEPAQPRAAAARGPTGNAPGARSCARPRTWPPSTGWKACRSGTWPPRPASARAACTRTSAPSRNSSWPPWTRRSGSCRQKSSSPPSRPAPAWPSWRRYARRTSATWSAASSPAAASSPPRRWRWAPAPGRSRTGSPPSSSGFTALLAAFAATALEQHELPAREDPGRLAFELHAILLGADTKFILNDDPAALDLARQIIRQRLGLDNRENPGES